MNSHRFERLTAIANLRDHLNAFGSLQQRRQCSQNHRLILSNGDADGAGWQLQCEPRIHVGEAKGT